MTPGYGVTPRTVLGWWLPCAVTAAIVSAGCLPTYAMSPESAAVQRAAIHHDLKRDSGTLFVIASKRAKLVRPDLSDRAVVCAISNIDIQFLSETHATYTAAYACGIAPWQPGRTSPVAAPTIALDLLKEGGVWMINGFL